MIKTIIIIVLVFIILLENIILLLVFKRINKNLKEEMAKKFLDAYQTTTGSKLSYKQEKKLLSKLSSEKLK